MGLVENHDFKFERLSHGRMSLSMFIVNPVQVDVSIHANPQGLTVDISPSLSKVPIT